MLERLKQLLNRKSDSEEDSTDSSNQLDTVITDLNSAIDTVKTQYTRTHQQEIEILNKLEVYYKQYDEKIKKAKEALASKSNLLAEGYYKESEILNHQINQYKKIASDIQSTKQKLMSQESRFSFTKDKLLSKKTMGEAQVDASQLNAELSEQLMYLNESDELSKFDELIEEADSKSQAIEEIQEDENSLDKYLADSSPALNKLENLVKKEQADKLADSLKNQKVLIDQVFGKFSPEDDKTEIKRKNQLLEELKSAPEKEEVKDETIKDFFENNDLDSTENDQEDRVKNFFQKEESADKQEKESIIKHFFNNK